VGVLLDLGLDCSQTLRYREVFGRKNDSFEGF